VADENTAPLHFEEDIRTQAARAAEDFSWDLGADAVNSAPDLNVNSGIEMVVIGRSKNSVSLVMFFLAEKSELLTA
jgi:hypothetical protein